MQDLSLKARRKLMVIERKLGAKETLKMPLDESLEEILVWCDEQEFCPGRALRPRHFFFDANALVKINQILHENGFSHYQQQYAELDRAQTAALDPNEKRAGIAPTASQLLVAVMSPALLSAVSEQFYSLSRLNLELDVNKLVLTNYSAMVVVENRDSFYQWFQFVSPLHESDTLVVYRGDKCHSRACKDLRKRWNTECPERPMYYFGDLDLAGLRFAISGDYTGLLLPSFKDLTQSVISQHYPEEQLRYLPRLQQICPSGWRLLLDLITRKRAGLRQQLMINMPLIPVDREKGQIIPGFS